MPHLEPLGKSTVQPKVKKVTGSKTRSKKLPSPVRRRGR
jgi:hypothetical protein